MPFDYNASAELFLAKRTRMAARTTSGSLRRLRQTVTSSKACERRKPWARGCSRGRALQQQRNSAAFLKPMIIRCASLSDRAPAHEFATRASPFPAFIGIDPAPEFQKSPVKPRLG